MLVIISILNIAAQEKPYLQAYLMTHLLLLLNKHDLAPLYHVEIPYNKDHFASS